MLIVIIVEDNKRIIQLITQIKHSLIEFLHHESVIKHNQPGRIQFVERADHVTLTFHIVFYIVESCYHYFLRFKGKRQ